MHWQQIPPEALAVFRAGAVIPAHPLALDADRRLDQRRQRALSRYYLDAGAGGLAVGVHTTQFAIRDPNVRLFEPVLRLAIETVRECENRRKIRLARVAGICGATTQAIAEAELAAIEATLPPGDHQPGEVVPVRLRAAVTEVGTLQLLAVPRTGDARWKVELEVRSS